MLEQLRQLTNNKYSFIAGGDFNIDLLDANTEKSIEFINSSNLLALHPIITLPTRVTVNSRTLIDNFLCDFSLLPLKSTVITTDISDHYAIALHVSNEIPTNTLYKRNFCSKHKEIFTTKLINTDWTHLYTLSDVDKAFNYFIKKLKRIYNKTFPFTLMNIKHQTKPWLTTGLLNSIKTKNKLYLRAKRDPNIKSSYIKYKNHLTYIIRKAKEQYCRNTLNDIRNNSSKLWQHLTSLIKPKVTPNIPIKSEELNDFFTSVFKQAPSHPKNQHCTISSKPIDNSFFLNPVTCHEIIAITKTISNSRSVGNDGFNSLIIKNNIFYIVNQLQFIFNLSLTTGIFPRLLKDAIVTPIHKGGTTSDPGNYRPISILTLFSKLLEKIYYNRLLNFINKHNILHENQFGFRSGKSTSSAIAYVTASLINKLQNNKHTAFVLLDLKKAFDFINHDLLLTKLNHFGIRGLPLAWMNSYLTNRRQKTKVNSIFSSYKYISAGCPQGSILAPLMFILFINDVFQFSTKDIEIILYADDTAILFSANNDAELQLIINNFFDKYVAWCTNNCIVINPNKSNYLTLNSNVIITIDNQQIANLSYVKYLGILFDKDLYWNYQVNHVTTQCSQRIGIFKRVLHYLPTNIRILYYNAFIRSCFSYCLIYWFNNDRSGRYKLINKIDHLIARLAMYCKMSTNNFVKKYHVLNVFDVHKLQSLLLMYDVCNNTAYLPFVNFVTNNVIHSHNTRSNINLHIEQVSSIDKRNFIYHCMLYWNACPIHVRALPKHKFIQFCKPA